MSKEDKECYYFFYVKYQGTIKGKNRIFHLSFVNNNKNNCNIIYNGKQFEITEYFDDIDINYNHNSPIEFLLKIKNNIKDLSYMFCNCETLLSFNDINDNNYINKIEENFSINPESSISEITKGSENFYGKNFMSSKILQKKNIISSGFSDMEDNTLSKKIFGNVIDMSFMFYKCSSLVSLPELSKWETKNVINMSGMFYRCSSLVSLPDISKWDTKNVINMSGLFSECSSLLSLPDISKWNIDNVNQLFAIFNKCTSLNSLPDISKWNTKNVKQMYGIFYKCSSLISLPDISKWNLDNSKSMSYMFAECSSLISLPDTANYSIT